MYKQDERPYEREEKDWYAGVLDPPAVPAKPAIVCLCGSTRFKEEFEQANEHFTLAGKIVLMPGAFTHAQAAEQRAANPKARVFGDKELRYGQDVAKMLDTLYLRKIDMADEIFVINVAGYVGESTKREIEYARFKKKKINWLEIPIEPNECSA